MNETIIKEVIKFKLQAAETLVDCLPTKVSEEIKDLGRIILQSVNENMNLINENSSKKSKQSDKLNDIPIE